MTTFLFLFATAGLVLTIYVRTLSPSIAGGDSGEIVAEGCHLGTAHPPGYPLMTILVNLLSLLKEPTGLTVGYWINTSSALFTAASSLLISLTIAEYSNHELAGALIGTSLFAFSPLIWQYAVTAEVFPINTFFASLIVYLTVRFSKTQKTSLAIVGAFFCGLAICDQHTIILFEVPLICWMLFLLRKRLYYHPELFVKLAIAFLLGLSFYLYLPISAIMAHKPGSWGDVASTTGFLHHFLRKDYGTFQLFSGKTGKLNENLWQRNAAYWKDFSKIQILYPWAYLVFLGAIASIVISVSCDPSYEVELESLPAGMCIEMNRTKNIAMSSSSKKKLRKAERVVSAITTNVIEHSEQEEKVSLINISECKWTPLLLLFTQLFYFFVFHSLSNLPLSDRLLYGVHQRFWMQPSILSCIWIGIGLNSILLFMKSLLPTTTALYSTIMSLVFLALAIYISFMQYEQHYYVSDQSNAWYFHQYAKAVLSPLPLNSVLLINYDQQWTSVRYLQVCEGFRPDITAIQLSMMSYKWFETKRSLYQRIPLYEDQPLNQSSLKTSNTRSISFPGKYLTYYGSPALQQDQAFHLISFLDQNLENWNGQIYLGGKLGSFDVGLSQFYELIPVGLVSRFYPQSQLSTFTAKEYSQELLRSWETVWDALGNYFPPEDKYPEETWEWTINRDYKDRLIDSSSYFLAQAIMIANTDPMPLVNALYALETAFVLEGLENSPTSLLKNLGLGHVHLIQNKLLSDEVIPKPWKDLFQSLEKIGWPSEKSNERWKEWSANRFTYHWGHFLQRSDATADPQYPTIKQLYDTVTGAVSKQPPPSQSAAASSSTSKPEKKSKQRKEKKKATTSEL